MGIPFSLIVIAAGAILTWGVTSEPSGLNLDAIGVVLMVVGVVGLVLTLLFWRSWWGPGYWSSSYVEDGPQRSWYDGRAWGPRRRTTYVEDDAPPPPPPP